MNWQETDDELWPEANYADDEVFQWLQAEQATNSTATTSADPHALATALTALNQALASLNSTAVVPSSEDYAEPEQGEAWGAIIGAIASAVPAIVNLIGQATSSRRRTPARLSAPRPAQSPSPAVSPPPAPVATAAPATLPSTPSTPVAPAGPAAAPSAATAPERCRCPTAPAAGEWWDEGLSSDQSEAVAAVVPLLTQLLPVILQLLPVALQAGGQAAGAMAQHGPALANLIGSLSRAIPAQAPTGSVRPSTSSQRTTREMEGNPVYLEYQP